MSNLHTLNFSGNDLPDQCLRDLAAMPSLKLLACVDVPFSAEAIAEFRESRPTILVFGR